MPWHAVLRGIDPRDGSERWRVETGGLRPIAGDERYVLLASPGVLPDPDVDADVLQRRLRALDRRTGKTLWKLRFDEAGLLAAASGAGVVAVVVGAGPSSMTDAHLDLFDAVTGRRRASVALVPSVELAGQWLPRSGDTAS